MSLFINGGTPEDDDVELPREIIMLGGGTETDSGNVPSELLAFIDGKSEALADKRRCPLLLL